MLTPFNERERFDLGFLIPLRWAFLLWLWFVWLDRRVRRTSSDTMGKRRKRNALFRFSHCKRRPICILHLAYTSVRLQFPFTATVAVHYTAQSHAIRYYKYSSQIFTEQSRKVIASAFSRSALWSTGQACYDIVRYWPGTIKRSPTLRYHTLQLDSP